ncbi:MAG TPA: hypothetical protein VK016_04340 [Arenimonas sp.]|nr:hypothetical protein [Arenimonas sp.]
MNTFKWLLKREYWEHRGGLFWAPVVTSAIFIFFTIVALLLAALGINQANEMHTGLDISEGIAQLGNPDNQADVSAGLELIFYMLGHPIMIVMAFVGFFYCLSSLYDERKDRSILFWKSLPISDHLTVASKVVTATLIVPLVAVIGASVTALVIMVVLSIFVAAHGANPIYFWDVGAIAKAIFNMFAAVPIYALWALPTVGWLMLCSAWARRVPFIWAVLVPVLSGVLVWMLGVLDLFGKSTGWFWGQIVGRVLSGTIPGMDIIYRVAHQPVSDHVDGPADLVAQLSVSANYAVFAMPQMWIGVALGALMIFAAIRLRGNRDEG